MSLISNYNVDEFVNHFHSFASLMWNSSNKNIIAIQMPYNINNSMLGK